MVTLVLVNIVSFVCVEFVHIVFEWKGLSCLTRWLSTHIIFWLPLVRIGDICPLRSFGELMEKRWL